MRITFALAIVLALSSATPACTEANATAPSLDGPKPVQASIKVTPNFTVAAQTRLVFRGVTNTLAALTIEVVGGPVQIRALSFEYEGGGRIEEAVLRNETGRGIAVQSGPSTGPHLIFVDTFALGVGSHTLTLRGELPTSEWRGGEILTISTDPGNWVMRGPESQSVAVNPGRIALAALTVAGSDGYQAPSVSLVLKQGPTWDSLELSWVSEHALFCLASDGPWAGKLKPEDKQYITAVRTVTTFEITCQAANGITSEDQVIFTPKMISTPPND